MTGGLLRFAHRVFVVFLLVVWLCILWLSQKELRRIDEKKVPLLAKPSKSILVARPSEASKYKNPFSEQRVLNKKDSMKFLVFHGDIAGQGTGNRMNGLLAAHLLGDEFNRTVCVSPAFEEFFVGFKPVHPSLENCPKMFQTLEKAMRSKNPKQRQVSFRKPPHKLVIEMINYKKGYKNECDLQSKLASNTPIWFLKANMYPRWRSIPENYFARFYQPTSSLQELLPNPLPKTVVHLRKEDSLRDFRSGLDKASLGALGEYFRDKSPPPYLVTNNVEWYTYFEKEYGWTHPKWEKVVHSVQRQAIVSHKVTKSGRLLNVQPKKRQRSDDDPTSKQQRARQTLEMWSDWYTCLQAEVVLHTFSDFSASAIHWGDPSSQASRTIRSFNETTTELELVKEWWRRDGLVLPSLGERKGDELVNCNAKMG